MKTRVALAAIGILMTNAAVFAQEAIQLYPGAAPGTEDWAYEVDEKEYFSKIFNTEVVTNVSQPTLTPYLPDPDKATGTAVIIAPGGGFHALSINSEGIDVAKWLNERGVAGFVLRYRLFPTGEDGDTHARIMVRMAEMVQSKRIIEQALRRLPTGPVNVDDARVILPPKAKVYGSIEGVMNQFKLIYEGIQVPAGTAYGLGEGANGELGFYCVSDGGGRPYRIKVRPPCFPVFGAYASMIKGGMISDAIATLGSLNIIAGELDR